MVSTNYSSCFQPLPSQEGRVVPYIEPPFVPTVGKLFLTCNQYTAQNENGTYTVSVKLLRDEEGVTIEHVSNGNLLMRIQILSEKLLDHNSRNEYYLLSDKYHELFLDYHRSLSKKMKEESKIRKAERKVKQAECEREHEEKLQEIQRVYDESMKHPIVVIGKPAFLVFNFMVTHGINAAITVKDTTQHALIATGETVAKTARVAKENISKLVFFCSYALVRVKPSAGDGRNYDMEQHVDMWKAGQLHFQSLLERLKRDSNFSQISQNTSYSPSPVAQLLYNEKKM